jgi:hypothetical protein
MLFILGATASDDASDFACDYAIAELEPSQAETILGRMDFALMLYGRDRSAHEIRFWDNAVTFYRRPIEEEFDHSIPRDASLYHATADASVASRGMPLSTDCEHMVIAVNSLEPEVYWDARGKQAPIIMQTAPLPRSEIARAANRDQFAASFA